MQQQLGLEGIPAKLVRVTPARLSTWAGCPRRYRMAYLDRPAPKRGGAWANATLGAVVHNALKAYFDLRPEKRTPQRAEVLVHRHWKSDGFADSEQAADYRRRAQRWVRDYVAGLDAEFTPVAVERWVSAPVGEIIAEGRVDRVDSRDGELVVVDYKTGRHGLRVDDAKNSLALGLYALAVRRALRRPCNRVELHHLPTGTVSAWDHTPESLDELRERAERLAGELQDATDAWESATTNTVAEKAFPVRTGPHCSWCDFRAHCTEGQQAAPDLRPWALLGDG
ncbi:PD-(D/E)XK nuclease family protein [Saccharopolyspora rhizosphaerae]|uniref:PD-(D/E)XK nuclease family protein n=1 Tax=Saccharopolyspora rhizosphaerae TaxID=2492662 RepID=A0A3R8QMD9_9PSEU|nr:PD-(D/E)XK nuclease family protein [Saccharopolyspora rhizosphaerae]RRO15593.1 PD-(D/E)XK nuclease family protein [Saccharopolyspora rhizosphaerae]